MLASPASRAKICIGISLICCYSMLSIREQKKVGHDSLMKFGCFCLCVCVCASSCFVDFDSAPKNRLAMCVPINRSLMMYLSFSLLARVIPNLSTATMCTVLFVRPKSLMNARSVYSLVVTHTHITHIDRPRPISKNSPNQLKFGQRPGTLYTCIKCICTRFIIHLIIIIHISFGISDGGSAK